MDYFRKIIELNHYNYFYHLVIKIILLYTTYITLYNVN